LLIAVVTNKKGRSGSIFASHPVKGKIRKNSVANSRWFLLITVVTNKKKKGQVLYLHITSSVCGYTHKEDSVANSRNFLLVAVVTNKKGRVRFYICISLPVCVGTYIRKTVLPTPGKFCL
jgi:hypothetical protein